MFAKKWKAGRGRLLTAAVGPGMMMSLRTVDSTLYEQVPASPRLLMVPHGTQSRPRVHQNAKDPRSSHIRSSRWILVENDGWLQ